MAEHLASVRRSSRGRAVAALCGLVVGLASPAMACTAVAPGVVLCPEGSATAQLRLQRFDDVVTLEGAGLQIEFNPLLSEAVPAGAAAYALDELVAMLLSDPDAPTVDPMLRDRFETEVATVERRLMQIEADGGEVLGGVLLAEFADGTPRLAWSVTAAHAVTLDELRAMTEATAAGLRPGTEN